MSLYGIQLLPSLILPSYFECIEQSTLKLVVEIEEPVVMTFCKKE